LLAAEQDRGIWRAAGDGAAKAPPTIARSEEAAALFGAREAV
jgi:hypothetical protein